MDGRNDFVGERDGTPDGVNVVVGEKDGNLECMMVGVSECVSVGSSVGFVDGLYDLVG